MVLFVIGLGFAAAGLMSASPEAAILGILLAVFGVMLENWE